VRRPAVWLGFAVLSIAAAALAIRYFPQAFSIVALDITMDREQALARSRELMARDSLGPAGYRQAASFSLDDEAQTFVELEGGGKEAFTSMLRTGLYSAYTWRVRQFREGETNETTIRFTPEGTPYGFVEKLREDAPGAALDAGAARSIAERGAARWNVDLSQFTMAEQGQERRVKGRVDHTFTFERNGAASGEGRYRLRLVVSGDRLTEVTHFVRIPEAFTRRYANMRSLNEAIGIGSVVGLMLLYVIGGIGVGLFFMMRLRWVQWRHAAFWGMAVGGLQALNLLNEFPLAWMAYDTAIPRSTFLAQQAATAVASFIGFSAFFGVSFMAAETLTRRAFGRHPQLWRTWSPKPPDGDPAAVPGASVQVLGRTLGGLLLVSVFLAYDVMLYFVATKYFGWWSPSEALLHPDVLATHAPWLSAIANSFQAGFWEESLFRAVPLAGAALIGDRFGKRGLFLVVGFVVQAAIFGAGHAPYPAQPAYARPVELIIPSIGFGLLYLAYGLLPGIILHYAFDAVLFSIPILLAEAPGIWLQKALVALFILVPLWVVLIRRVRAGRWTELSAADRNAAWIPPPPAAAPEPSAAEAPRATIGRRARTAWLAVAAVGLIVCIAAAVTTEPQTLSATRAQAEAATRRAIGERGVTLEPRWRVLPVPLDGSGGPHEFVAETAGEARRKELIGKYLPAPGWSVRVASFQGDVAARAEEWGAVVSASGELRRLQHRVPEDRPGVSLSEADARAIAVQALAERRGLDVARGQAREVSAQPSKLKARTDWTFTFADTTIAPLPEGEPRVEVEIAGNEVAVVRPYVFVPEAWERRQRAAGTRDLIIRIVDIFVFAGLLVGAAILGMMAWSRRRYTPRLFVIAAATMLLVSIARSVNNYPVVLAALQTALPLPLQIIGAVGIGLVGLAISAVLVGLVLGAVPHRLAPAARLPEGDALHLAIASGIFGAAAAAAAGALRSPAWANAPEVAAAGTVVPILQAALDPLTRVLMTSAILLPTLLTVDQFTSGWRRRRIAGAALLIVTGIAGAGVPESVHVLAWLGAALAIAAALIVAYVAVLRFDLSMVPLALATMVAMSTLLRGAERAYPGAVIGALLGAALTWALGWWWFNMLRRSRDRVV